MGKKKKYIMYIDETGGEGGLDFTLTGVIFEYKYCINENSKSQLDEKLDEFKQLCFNRKDLTLHLNEISRRQRNFREIPVTAIKKFYTELPNFLNNLDFEVISITVDTKKLNDYYLSPQNDSYVIAFTHLMETFYSFLNKKDIESARIVLESRDANCDLAIQKAFFEVFNNGTLHLNIDEVKNKIKGFIFAPKGDLLYGSGLEIADIICNPLARVRQGLVEANPKCFKDYGRENKIFKILKSKIYNGNPEHDFRNWGFKKVPIVKRKREWIDNPN